jgi:hypothetical protein
MDMRQILLSQAPDTFRHGMFYYDYECCGIYLMENDDKKLSRNVNDYLIRTGKTVIII